MIKTNIRSSLITQKSRDPEPTCQRDETSRLVLCATLNTANKKSIKHADDPQIVL